MGKKDVLRNKLYFPVSHDGQEADSVESSVKTSLVSVPGGPPLVFLIRLPMFLKL